MWIITQKPPFVYHRRHYFFIFAYTIYKAGDKGMRFDNQVVGRVIRRLRKKKGLSQEVVSGLAGIARTHLTMIENGSKQPNYETIWKIALALNIKPSELTRMVEEEILSQPT